MPIRWKTRAMKSPKTGETKYYAQIATRTKVDFNTLADEIEKLTSLTAGDALNMLRTMQYQIIQHLQNNDTVMFDQLGTFVPTITSSGSSSADKVSSDNIKTARVRFIVGSGLKKAFARNQLTFVDANTADSE